MDHADEHVLDRAIGAVLGTAVGDVMGAPYEFGSAPFGPDGAQLIGGGLGNCEPGEWTDDTSMTWCVLDAAHRFGGLTADAALDRVARNFHAWYESRPPDIGMQTQKVLNGAGPDPTARQLADASLELHRLTGHTAGNGSLMRTSPVALPHLDAADAVATAALRVSELTHADPRAGQACVLWSLAIRHAVLTGEIDVRVGLDQLDAEAQEFWTARITEAQTQPAVTFNPNGWVVTAFQAAWAAIVSVAETPTAETYVAGVNAAIAIGNDTDTVAAIAGGLLGAAVGAEAIPDEWRSAVHGYPGIDGAALVTAVRDLLGRPVRE